MQRDDTPSDTSANPLELSPLYIPGLIEPIQTPGAVGGINRNMIHANVEGLLVILQPYLNMQQGDWVEIFWGNDTVPVAADTVLPEHLGSGFPIFISAGLVPEGINELHAKVTRASNGNEESSPKMAILVRTLLPGGIDPEPGTPGHQNLLPPEPELPPSGIIDEDAAKNGIKVTIPAYPNIREFDTLTFSWGGVQLRHEVTPADIAAGAVELLVTEDVILEAGASDQLLLEYWIWDEVHNLASDWSLHTYVTVEVGEGLFDPPLIENPDSNADPYDVIDLEDLGDDDLLVSVMVVNGAGLQAGDLIAPKWIGTTAQGLPIEFSPAPESVPRVPTVMTFLIPNAEVRGLAQGRGIASYAVSRSGNPLGNSKRAFVNFIGVEQSLPKPQVPDAVNGVLDPALTEATVIVPGAALDAGDIVYLTWLGTRANGSPLLHEDERGVSGGGAGQPMTFSVPGQFIAPLDGGTVVVYYRVYKRSIGRELESDREHLTVGESQAQLPAPTTNPPAVNGVLDPTDLTTQLEIIVPAWPGMNARQTVHLVWSASGIPNHEDFMPVSAPMVGMDVEFFMSRAQVEAYRDKSVELSYWIEEPGETSQVSVVARFSVSAAEQPGTGALCIMGARHNATAFRGASSPRLLTALDRDTFEPVLAEWRYEDEQQWTSATHWRDEKPALTLYARSGRETWECPPANITGNGLDAMSEGNAAFVARRDEVIGENGAEVDMVAWGNPDIGGALDSNLINLSNVVEVSSSGLSFAARLRDGNAVCWGYPSTGGVPPMVSGPFDLLRGNGHAFVGRKTDGRLFAWGNEKYGGQLSGEALRHSDYVHISAVTFAFAALRASGHVVAWGHEDLGGKLFEGQDQYDDIVQVLGSSTSFAALRDSGNSRSVIAWGMSETGGVTPDDISKLVNVKSLCAATFLDFCIQLESGELKSWPSMIPEDVAGVTNIREVTATGYAFCALLTTGKVLAWGDQNSGGNLTSEVEGKSNIVQVTGNERAFAALCSDGTVVAWGEPETGGDTSKVVDELVNVRAIYANCNAFAALTEDGRVVTWGVDAGGGNSDRVQPELYRRVTARRLLPPTEADAIVTPTLTSGARP